MPELELGNLAKRETTRNSIDKMVRKHLSDEYSGSKVLGHIVSVKVSKDTFHIGRYTAHVKYTMMGGSRSFN